MIPDFEHGAAARNHRMLATEAWLRRRFATGGDSGAVTGGDGFLIRPETELRPAAVLVPVVCRNDGLTVLFTRRSAHLHDHAGQISFPGGRSEPGESPVTTALRESAEEVGLDPGRVEVVGTLRDYLTVTGYRVTPVVGLVSAADDLTPDEFEVAEIFEVPLAFLLDPANHQRTTVRREGVERPVYAMPYREYYIWGATAGMLMNFYHFLSA